MISASTMCKLPPYTTVLCDLNGTLHVGSDAIKNGAAALQRLKQTLPHVNITYVSNTTKQAKASLLTLLNKLDYSIQPHELHTSLSATAALFARGGKYSQYQPMLLLNNESAEEFRSIMQQQQSTGSDYNAVVIGLSPSSYTYDTLNKAFNVLMQPPTQPSQLKPLLIACHPGKYHQTATGLQLGPGAYMSALQYSSGVQPVVVGKPSQQFFQSVIDALELGVNLDEYKHSDQRDVCMVGDDVSDDCLGAQQHGIDGILVRTGKYRAGDEQKYADTRGRPTHVFDSVVDFVDALIEAHQQRPHQTAKL